QEVEDYKPAHGPACTTQNFRPDLTSTPGSEWNASVIDVFGQYYATLNAKPDRKTVNRLFRGHLKYLCNRYQQSLEGEAAVLQRQKLARKAERQRNVRVPRCSKVVEAHVLRRFGIDIWASEESDHKPNGEAVYRILKKTWRNPLLTPWLRTFDKLHDVSRLDSLNGSLPHKRIPSNIVSDRRPAVRGLPHNAYNPRWLASLTDHDRMLLCVKMDKQYKFSHSDKLTSRAYVKFFVNSMF
ncbi:hypothetical protein C8Q80DRAFT_1113468, partial [Daedaleopsis nitida]